MSAISFVNIHGAVVNVNTALRTPVKRASKTPDSFHRGWRVMGISQEMIAEAREKNEREISNAQAHNIKFAKGATDTGRVKVPAPFDEDTYLKSAKRRPVRAKPYEIRSAADTCAEMASKAGWLQVVVKEIKKEKQKGAAFV